MTRAAHQMEAPQALAAKHQSRAARVTEAIQTPAASQPMWVVLARPEGATSTGGMLGTGGTPANSCTTALDCVSAPIIRVPATQVPALACNALARRIALPILAPITIAFERNA